MYFTLACRPAYEGRAWSGIWNWNGYRYVPGWIDSSPRTGVRTSRDDESIDVRRRAAAVRAAQRDGPMLARGDHRLLDRRRGRDRPAARGRGQRQDDEDDDEQERDADERRESQGKERRGTHEGEGDRGHRQDPDDDCEDEADGHGVRRWTARNRGGKPSRGRGRRLGHASELDRP